MGKSIIQVDLAAAKRRVGVEVLYIFDWLSLTFQASLAQNKTQKIFVDRCFINTFNTLTEVVIRTVPTRMATVDRQSTS